MRIVPQKTERVNMGVVFYSGFLKRYKKTINLSVLAMYIGDFGWYNERIKTRDGMLRRNDANLGRHMSVIENGRIFQGYSR